MQVLVDTSVWSLALRRAKNSKLIEIESKAVETLRDLIADSRAVMIGAIRQELLSGIKDRAQWNSLREALSGFEDIELKSSHYEAAAQCFNTCRGQGIAGSNSDFLICAAAISYELPILSTDKDFQRYQRHLKFDLLV